MRKAVAYYRSRPSEPEAALGQARLATALHRQRRPGEARASLDEAMRWAREKAGGRSEFHSTAPRGVSSWIWWDLMLALREAEALLLDDAFPAQPFAP